MNLQNYIFSLQTKSRAFHLLLLSKTQNQQTKTLFVKGQAVSFFPLSSQCHRFSFFPGHTLTSFSVSVFSLHSFAPLHSRILRSVPDSPGTRTCKGSAPARAHGGTGSDVAWRTVPARPADVTAAAVPSEAQEWEFKEGKHGGDPAVGAERCDCPAYCGFWGSSGRNGASSAGRVHPPPSACPHARFY